MTTQDPTVYQAIAAECADRTHGDAMHAQFSAVAVHQHTGKCRQQDLDPAPPIRHLTAAADTIVEMARECAKYADSRSADAMTTPAAAAVQASMAANLADRARFLANAAHYLALAARELTCAANNPHYQEP